MERSRHFVEERLADGKTQFHVAFANGVAVGFVHLLPAFDTLALGKAWILEDLFVAPAYRRRGIASALLARAERFALETKATRISLSTAHTNFEAQRLYLAHGYRFDERFRTYHRALD